MKSQIYLGKKFYIRLDGKGNPIAGQTGWYKKQPVNGRWKEITDPLLCCNTTTSTTTTEA